MHFIAFSEHVPSPLHLKLKFKTSLKNYTLPYYANLHSLYMTFLLYFIIVHRFPAPQLKDPWNLYQLQIDSFPIQQIMKRFISMFIFAYRHNSFFKASPKKQYLCRKFIGWPVFLYRCRKRSSAGVGWEQVLSSWVPSSCQCSSWVHSQRACICKGQYSPCFSYWTW